MMQTLGIVQACQTTAPAVGKAGRKLGGKTLLEWVVRRATDSQRLDSVIVLGGHAQHEELRALVPFDVPLYSSHEPDALAQCLDAAEHYQAQAVLRIVPDNPFLDPVLVDRLVNTASRQGCDYVGFCSSDGRATTKSPLGVLPEWCSTAALRQAARGARDPRDRAEVTRYLHMNAQHFKVRMIAVPSQLDKADVRLRLDLEEDWEHAQVIFEALGPEEWDWQHLAGLLDQQPALRKRMAVLNRTVKV